MAPAAASGAATGQVSGRRVAGFLVMVFGMFMAILDIQIVSASLAEIQAGISASGDEISWVQTAYLIAEVVMIPLSGFLGRWLSTRTLFTLSAAGFTLSSLACGLSDSVGQMILFRAFQGFIGGAMIPTTFAAAFTIFPGSRRNMVSAMVGLIATLAPTIGPTVGGYVSHAMSWHWLFLINLPIGLAVTVAAWALIDFDRGDPSLRARFDWLGFAGMAAFLGALEYVLEEGSGEDWFDSELIGLFTLISAAGAALFFWRALTRTEPIVDLRAFANRNFAFGSMFSFVMGIGLYGLTYLYPLYLGRIRGYDSLQIGETMFVSGICMFLTAPLAGRLAQKFDPRLMLMIGFLGFGAGTWLMGNVTADWDFNEILLPQILRGCSLMLCMVPINNLALGTMPPEKMKNASGLYNLMRNLGGAVGLAVINTLLSDRSDLHLARLTEGLNWAREGVADRLALMARMFAAQGLDGERTALAQVARLAQREANVMSFADVFMALTALFGALALAAFLMRKPPPAPAGAGGGH